MSDFRNLIKEIKATLRKLLVFDTFIEALLIFLCIYIFLMVFNIFPVTALIPALIYFLVMLYKRRNLTSIRIVEEKYPVLNEALRTASDTIKEDNYVVNELRNRVRRKIRHVKASSFMNIGGDAVKIILTIGLIFLILSISICQGVSQTCQKAFSAIDIQKAVKEFDMGELKSKLSVSKLKTLNISESNEDYEVEAKNLFLGQDKLANLGDKKLKLKIKLTSDQIDIRDVTEAKKKEFMESEISEVYATGDVSFDENINREYQDIVRNYFHTISKGE